MSQLENALGAELLRAEMLGAPRPQVAGRYLVERFVGRGATGLVVAAVDETLDRRVALKLSPAGAVLVRSDGVAQVIEPLRCCQRRAC